MTDETHRDNLIKTHLRQMDFFDPSVYEPKIVQIGAGGLGSWSAIQMAKLGIRDITVYDMDRVEEHNLGSTPYTAAHLGTKKVVALSIIVEEFGFKPHYRGIPRQYKGEKFPKADIVISTVDSMDARRLLFREVKNQKIPFFIDGRIGGENLRVYAIQPGFLPDRLLYQKSLVPNHRVTPLPCTAQQVIDVGWITSSLIVRAVRQWVVLGRYTPEVIVKVDSLAQVVAQPQMFTCKICRPHAAVFKQWLFHWHRLGHPEEAIARMRGMST